MTTGRINQITILVKETKKENLFSSKASPLDK